VACEHPAELDAAKFIAQQPIRASRDGSKRRAHGKAWRAYSAVAVRHAFGTGQAR